MNFHQTTLANGLAVVAEINPHALSTAVGFFVRAGSRDEPAALSGVSHFLEHMAFKGTDARTADDVNRQFDEIGAKYNAYTTEEHTVYHAAVLPEYLPTAVDLLGDLLRPSLRQDDFDMEKNVILEEIGMYADSPMWLAYEKAMRRHFSDHPLGNIVLGTEATVGALTRDAMADYHRSRYSPSNCFLACSGRLEWDRLVNLAESKCGAWEPIAVERVVPNGFTPSASELVVTDKFVQQSIFMLFPAPTAESTQRIAADVLSSVIGDDTGSRFYWELIEPGKVESVDCAYHEYEGAGVFMVSASCQPDLAEENFATIKRILGEITRDGITREELEAAKNKLASRIVLAGERPKNRLFSTGYNWSYRKQHKSVEDELLELGRISLDSIRTLLDAYPFGPGVAVALGPLEKFPQLFEG